MPTLITLKAAVWQKEGFNVKEVQPSWTFQVHIVQFTLCSAYALLYMFLYMMSTCFLCFFSVFNSTIVLLKNATGSSQKVTLC